MTVLTVPGMMRQIDNEESFALLEEKTVANAMEEAFRVSDDSLWKGAAVSFSAYYERIGSFIMVINGDTVLSNALPFEQEPMDNCLSWERKQGSWFILIGDTLPGGCRLVYAREATALIRQLIGQWAGTSLLFTGLSLLVVLALYFTMKRVNRPVERLAHELRTPLTVISGYGELLQIANLNEEQRQEAAGYIVSESRRLGDIAQKLLLLSDIRANPCTMEKLSVPDLFDHVQKTWPKLSCAVYTQSVTGDKTLLLSLLDNLIGNAYKAGAKNVSLTARENRFTVEDDGEGMGEATLAYVNDPSRAENPSARSGLGVPLCHEIARLHKASLSFTSEAGKGTAATLTFYKMLTS